MKTYPKVVKAVKRVAERIKKQNLLCGTLVRLEFLDCYHYWTPEEKLLSRGFLTDISFL